MVWKFVNWVMSWDMSEAEIFVVLLIMYWIDLSKQIDWNNCIDLIIEFEDSLQ